MIILKTNSTKKRTRIAQSAAEQFMRALELIHTQIIKHCELEVFEITLKPHQTIAPATN